jgi:hypothetical protein
MPRCAAWLLPLALSHALLALTSAHATPTELPITAAGIKNNHAYVNTQGGAIRIFRAVTKPGATQATPTGEVVLSFGAIQELNLLLQPVYDGVTNAEHALRTLRSQRYACSSVLNYTMTSWVDALADCLLCHTNYTHAGGQPGTFLVSACVIKRAGQIIQQNEVSSVHPGQLKFTVSLPAPGWAWCGEACRGGAGLWLDLDIHIKLPPLGQAPRGARPESSQLPNAPKRFHLAAGAVVEFSTKTLLDGDWTSLAPGYPILGEKEGDHVVTLRIPRFSSSMLYDPTVDIDEEEVEGASGVGRPRPWSPLGGALSLVAGLLASLGYILATG